MVRFAGPGYLTSDQVGRRPRALAPAGPPGKCSREPHPFPLPRSTQSSRALPARDCDSDCEAYRSPRPQVADIVYSVSRDSKDPAQMCNAIVEQSSYMWKVEEGDYRDDMTATVLYLPCF